jgi:hypothetical protein
LDNSPVHDADGNAVYNPPLEENEIPMRWGKVAPDAVVKLPPIPGRLEGVATAEQDFGWSEMLREGVVKQPNKVIRIAAGDSFVMALRANGEVWMINCEEGSDYASNAWEFVSLFISCSTAPPWFSATVDLVTNEDKPLWNSSSTSPRPRSVTSLHRSRTS